VSHDDFDIHPDRYHDASIVPKKPVGMVACDVSRRYVRV